MSIGVQSEVVPDVFFQAFFLEHLYLSLTVLNHFLNTLRRMWRY